jgi:hypothetical protein
MKTVFTLVLTIVGLGLSVLAQTKSNLLSDDAMFSVDAKVAFTKDPVDPEFRKIVGEKPFEPNRYATGSLNGVAYKYFFSDGSASFEGSRGNGIEYRSGAMANWDIRCEKDPIDDSKSCILSIYDLRILIDSLSGPAVSIGLDTYPGRSTAIRFDQQPAITGGEIIKGEQAKRILAELKTAKQVTTRYSPWPSGGNADKTFELYGFNEAFAYVNWVLTKIK